MLQPLKNFWSTSFRRQCGNSLTFLIMATSILGLSVAATTVALAPMSSQNQESSQSLSLNAVANHHLDDLQAYILQHPEIFANNNNYAPSASPPAPLIQDYNNGVPAFEIFTGPDADQATPGANFNEYFANVTYNNLNNYNLLTHTENIQINNGTQVNVTSTLPWNADDTYSGVCTYPNPPATCTGDQGRYGIVRFAINPYYNTLRIMVKVTAGTNTMVRSRMITLSGKVCAVNNAPTPASVATIPAPSPNDPNVVSGLPPYQITQTSNAAIQIGDYQICWLPTATTQMYCDPQGLNAAANGNYALNILASGNDTLADGSQMFYVVFLMQQGVSPTPTGTYIQIEAISTTAAGVSTVIPTPKATGVVLYDPGGTLVPEPNPSDFTVIMQKPTDATDTYTAYIIWNVPSGTYKNKVYVTTAMWSGGNTNQFLNAAVGLYGLNINWGNLYDGSGAAIYNTSYAPTSNLTYNANSNQLILNGNYTTGGTRVLYGNISKLTPAVGGTASSLNFTTATCSTNPTLPVACSDPATGNNPAAVINSAGTFGSSVSSSDGKFIVTPVLDSANHVDIMAFNTMGSATNLSQRVSPSNTLDILDSPYPPNTISNIANIMTTHATILSNVEIKFYNGKFYWLVAGDSYVYEWDPKTWGMGAAYAQSLLQQITNNQFLQSTSVYTGNSTYFTVNLVREIGPAPGGNGSNALWKTNNPAPQMIFNEQNHEIYIQDGGAIHRVDLQAGYYYNFLSTYTNTPGGAASVLAATQPILIAFDKNSDTLYFSGVNTANINQGGLYTYIPSQGLPATGLTPLVTSTNHFNLGDNIFYVEQTQELYYVDGTTQNIYAYSPPCYDLNQVNSNGTMLLTGQ